MLTNKHQTIYFIKTILVISLIISCSEKSKMKEQNREITDLAGRKIAIPHRVEKIIAVNAGAMRFVSYMDAIPNVIGIEETERRTKRPYNFAFPEIKKKEIIGPQPSGDAELILKAQPEVIFWSSYATSKGTPDDLQKKVNIPVIAIKNGELGIDNEIIYGSMRVIGNVLRKEKRAEEVISYMEKSMAELKHRTENIPDHKKPTAYIGGLSFNGSRGLSSTKINFAPFLLTNTLNVADNLKYKGESTRPVTIDLEKIIDWNPDYIFIDSDGWKFARNEIKKNLNIYKRLNAFKNNRIYIIPRYINNSISYDYALIDSWYIGKILYPEKFSDIDIEQKSIEILEKFYNKKINLKDFDLEFKQVYLKDFNF